MWIADSRLFLLTCAASLVPVAFGHIPGTAHDALPASAQKQIGNIFPKKQARGAGNGFRHYATPRIVFVLAIVRAGPASVPGALQSQCGYLTRPSISNPQADLCPRHCVLCAVYYA